MKADKDMQKLIGCLYDSMTECVYLKPISSFTVETRPQAVFEVDILGKGRKALEKANDELGTNVLVTKFLHSFLLMTRRMKSFFSPWLSLSL